MLDIAVSSRSQGPLPEQSLCSVNSITYNDTTAGLALVIPSLYGHLKDVQDKTELVFDTKVTFEDSV